MQPVAATMQLWCRNPAKCSNLFRFANSPHTQCWKLAGTSTLIIMSAHKVAAVSKCAAVSSRIVYQGTYRCPYRFLPVVHQHTVGTSHEYRYSHLRLLEGDWSCSSYRGGEKSYFAMSARRLISF